MRKIRYMAFGLIAFAMIFMVVPVSAEDSAEAELKLRLMETTDIHTNLMNYDYFQDKEMDSEGLVLTATLIKQYRKDAQNSMLFDNGDLIQGTPLGDYVANNLKEGETHPVYKAMNLLDYDAANIGNHEFNFGLDFLDQSLAGADFPYVNSNVYDKESGENRFDPYVLLDRTFQDENGAEHDLTIGLIGFVPPQILQWDSVLIGDDVYVEDIAGSAEKFVPEMKEKGADIIVAIPHSGFGSTERKENEENAVYSLSKVDGIDAILFGHAHGLFPDKQFEGIEGVDVEKGTINGVAAVMAGRYGDHLGVVDLDLVKKNGEWEVADSQSETVPVYDSEENKPLVEPDEEIVEVLKEDHEAVLDYIRSPVGKTTESINSFFSLVQDDSSLQLVNDAQMKFMKEYIKDTEYADYPVLSAAAPFKAGKSASNYTDIAAGDIAVKDMADLYKHPNTVSAMLLTGEEVHEWLEMSAGQFHQIDPNSSEEQELIDRSFPTYLYDVIDGVDYLIDVSEPQRYDSEGNLVDESAHRIKNLQYNGKPIDKDQEFIITTNNYRAGGGGNFPGATKENNIFNTATETRQILIDYIQEVVPLDPTADNNWSLAPINDKVNVVFDTSEKAVEIAKEKYDHLEHVDSENGLAIFKIDFAAFESDGFIDVPPGLAGDHYDAIMSLSAQGIISGYVDGTFKPWNKVSRGQVAKMIANALDLEAPKDLDEVLSVYADVDAKNYYAKEIAAVTEAGIFKGDNETREFGETKYISREQMASVLVRAFDLENVDYDKEATINLDRTSAAHRDAIQILANLGITKNLEDYDAYSEITRAAFSSFLDRTMGVVE